LNDSTSKAVVGFESVLGGCRADGEETSFFEIHSEASARVIAFGERERERKVSQGRQEEVRSTLKQRCWISGVAR